MNSAAGGRHVVVAAALVRAGRVLVARRHPSRAWWPGVWDLPGGHVHPGEDARAALARELAEELGISATITGAPLAHVADGEMVMDVWLVQDWVGQVTNTAPDEHDALAWVDATGAAALQPAVGYLAGVVATAARAPA